MHSVLLLHLLTCLPCADFDPTGWMTAKMSRRVDPFIAYLVVAAKKALHDANLAEGSDEMCARSRAPRSHCQLLHAC